METRFVPDAPGAWLLYDLGALVLALPPESRASADAVAASPRTGVADVLAALRVSGLAASTPFALLHGTADGVHVALRGPATVAAGAETLTGLGAEPWLERRLPGVAVVRLTVPGGEWTFALASPNAVGSPAVAASTPVAAVRPVAVPAGPPPLLPATEKPAEPASAAEIPEVTEVPVADTEDPPEAPAPDVEEDRTIVVDEIAALRAKRSSGIAPPILPSPAPGPPPTRRLSLELPDGAHQVIDDAVLVGRAPGFPDGQPYRELRFADGDISRNHARITAEGGTVVVTDLRSRNGTIVRIPGREPQKLRGDEPTPVLPGTVIDFGGGIELVVRED